MVTSTSRGRPRSFDRQVVLDRSVDLFWEKGAAAASVRVLERELGIGQSSLYNTFGSKDGLINETIDNYQQRLDKAVFSRLEHPGRDALEDFVDALVDWICQENHRGCLVLNLAAEHADYRPRMVPYRSRLRQAVLASTTGFSATDTEAAQRAEVFVAAVFGLNVAARTGADDAELSRTAEAIKGLVRSW